MSTIDNILLNGTEYDIGGAHDSSLDANIEETVVSDAELNLLDEEWEDGKRISPQGEEESTYPQYTLTKNYYEVTTEDTITAMSPEYNNTSFVVSCYDSTKTWISNIDSGYMTKNVEKTLSFAEGTAYVRVYTTIANKGRFSYINIPITYVVKDWKDTTYIRMNQLAVRQDIYDKIDALETLLWNYTKWRGKYIVADGNSLVAASNWIATTCSFLGANAVNLGKSGGAITRPDQPSAGATIEQKKAFIVNNINTNYPAKADLILLQESSYLDGNYSDQMDGQNPSDSWCARMNYFIRCLKTKYPNVLIALMPDPTWYTSGGSGAGNDSTTNTNIADEIFNTRNRDSLEKMRGLAEYNRLAFFEVDHSTPFNPLMKQNYYARYYWTHEQYPTITQDGVHPYTPYNQAKGYALAHFIAGLIFDPSAPNDAQTNWTNMIYTINSDGSATYPDVD